LKLKSLLIGSNQAQDVQETIKNCTTISNCSYTKQQKSETNAVNHQNKVKKKYNKEQIDDNLLAFAKAAEAISARQKIKVQNGGEERRKNQKISKDNKVLRTKY